MDVMTLVTSTHVSDMGQKYTGCSQMTTFYSKCIHEWVFSDVYRYNNKYKLIFQSKYIDISQVNQMILLKLFNSKEPYFQSSFFDATFTW